MAFKCTFVFININDHSSGKDTAWIFNSLSLMFHISYHILCLIPYWWLQSIHQTLLMCDNTSALISLLASPEQSFMYKDSILMSQLIL